MTTKKHQERRLRSFKFTFNGGESWFYLHPDGCSFHQTNKYKVQQNVFGLPVSRLIRALEACGYITQRRKP